MLKDDRETKCCKAPYRQEVVIEDDEIKVKITCAVCGLPCELLEPPHQDTLEISVHDNIKFKDHFGT